MVFTVFTSTKPPSLLPLFLFDNSLSFLALMLLCPPLDPTSHNSIFPTVDCFSSLLFYRSLQIFVLGYSTYSQASVFSLLDIPSSSTFFFSPLELQESRR